MIQLMARPFFKTFRFWSSVNFDVAILYLRCLVDDIQILGMPLIFQPIRDTFLSGLMSIKYFDAKLWNGIPTFIKMSVSF